MGGIGILTDIGVDVNENGGAGLNGGVDRDRDNCPALLYITEQVVEVVVEVIVENVNATIALCEAVGGAGRECGDDGSGGGKENGEALESEHGVE